jgi:hypothetical protein
VKIYIQGGLGNQLFQFSYAHLSNETITIYKDPNPRSDRPFDISGLIKSCSHVSKEIYTSSTLFNFMRKISVNSINKFHPKIKSFITKISKIENENLNFDLIPVYKHKNKILNIGYFQHWKYVEEAFTLFGPELNIYIKQVELPKLIKINYDKTIIVHIRRGDYMSSHKDTLGVLDTKYYADSIKGFRNDKFHILFLTDDFKAASIIVKGIGLTSVSIFGPESLTAWQSLKIMSEAKYLIAANSTLSWWGSFLSSESGGHCILPKPWFKNYFMKDMDAFYFPKAFMAPSVFE